MGDGEPTELSGIAEAPTESAYAWALDEAVEWPRERWTPRRITAAALAASLVVIGGVGGVVWWHLERQESPTVVVQAPPPKVEAPPPVVVPPSTVTVTAPPPKPVDPDTLFITRLEERGWTIINAKNLTNNAHLVCQALREGETERSVGEALLAEGAVFSALEAESFVATSMQTYPNCP